MGKPIWGLSNVAWKRGSQYLKEHKTDSLSIFLFLCYLIKIAILSHHFLLGLLYWDLERTLHCVCYPTPVQNSTQLTCDFCCCASHCSAFDDDTAQWIPVAFFFCTCMANTKPVVLCVVCLSICSFIQWNIILNSKPHISSFILFYWKLQFCFIIFNLRGKTIFLASIFPSLMLTML